MTDLWGGSPLQNDFKKQWVGSALTPHPPPGAKIAGGIADGAARRDADLRRNGCVSRPPRAKRCPGACLSPLAPRARNLLSLEKAARTRHHSETYSQTCAPRRATGRRSRTRQKGRSRSGSSIWQVDRTRPHLITHPDISHCVCWTCPPVPQPLFCRLQGLGVPPGPTPTPLTPCSPQTARGS